MRRRFADAIGVDEREALERMACSTAALDAEAGRAVLPQRLAPARPRVLGPAR